MKKIKLLLLGIVSILGISFSFADFSYTACVPDNFSVIGGVNEIDLGHSCFFGSPTYFNGSTDSFFLGYNPSNWLPNSSTIDYYGFCGKFFYNNLDSNFNTTQNSSSYICSGDIFNSYNYSFSELVVGTEHSISVPRYDIGTVVIGSDDCIFTSQGSFLYVCTDSSCSVTTGIDIGYSRNLICGDTVYVKNTNKYSRDLGYYYLTGFLLGTGGISTAETGHIIVDGGYTTFAALVLETAVLCYMSDGDYNYTSYYLENGGLSCDDLGGSSGYVPFIESLGITNDTGIENKYWSGDYNNSGFPYGKLVFDDAKTVLNYYCSDSRYSYSFCDNLDSLSGSYLFYQFKNGVLEYNIIGENILLSFDTMSGVITDMSCYGVWCSSFPNTGFTQIDVNVFGSGGSIGELTGELSGYFIHQFQGFSSGSYTPQNFYSDYFKKGYFFRCPYNVKQYITLGSWLDSTLKQFSPAYPINCFISSFEAGRNLLLFKNGSGQYWSGSLINGNTDDHQRLFTFFDIILSFGLIVVLGKLFNILSNSGD